MDTLECVFVLVMPKWSGKPTFRQFFVCFRYASALLLTRMCDRKSNRCVGSSIQKKHLQIPQSLDRHTPIFLYFYHLLFITSSVGRLIYVNMRSVMLHCLLELRCALVISLCAWYFAKKQQQTSKSLLSIHPDDLSVLTAPRDCWSWLAVGL